MSEPPRHLVQAAVLVAALLASSVWAGADQPSQPPASPDVLLVTIDTLRPDALGWIGGGTHTPVIDRLAAQSARFRAAVTPVPLTAPAHASLLTGLDPPRHGLRVNGDALRRSGFSLARRLSDEGWATGAFISGYPLRREFGLDEGFDHYDDTLPLDARGEWLERDAFATGASALAWISEQQKPVFAWIHYFDAHDPYQPPTEFRQPGPRGDYLGEVAKIDAAIGVLLARFEQLRGSRPRLVVVTADHGESLGEHGEATHGFFIYDSTMLVPLIFHFPSRVAAREIVAAPRLSDVAPTIESLLDLPDLPERDGVSLQPLLRGTDQRIPTAWIESLEPMRGYGWAALTGVRSSTHKLIASPRPELYHLATDPGELVNVVDEQRRVARQLELEHRRLSEVAVSVGSAAVDGEGRAALAALGYLGGGPQDASTSRAYADPKDRLAAKVLLDTAEDAYRVAAIEVATRAWLAALTEDPGNPLAEQRLARLAVERGDFDEAIARFERARARAPDNGELAFELADALSRGRRSMDAVVAWRRATRLQPWRSVAWSNLSAMLLQERDLSGAVGAAAEAARLAPEDAIIRRNLAVLRLRLAAVRATAGAMEEAEHLLGLALAAEPSLSREVAADPRLARLRSNR